MIPGFSPPQAFFWRPPSSLCGFLLRYDIILRWEMELKKINSTLGVEVIPPLVLKFNSNFGVNKPNTISFNTSGV